jgi:hypothetical protein
MMTCPVKIIGPMKKTCLYLSRVHHSLDLATYSLPMSNFYLFR